MFHCYCSFSGLVVTYIKPVRGRLHALFLTHRCPIPTNQFYILIKCLIMEFFRFSISGVLLAWQSSDYPHLRTFFFCHGTRIQNFMMISPVFTEVIAQTDGWTDRQNVTRNSTRWSFIYQGYRYEMSVYNVLVGHICCEHALFFSVWWEWHLSNILITLQSLHKQHHIF